MSSTSKYCSVIQLSLLQSSLLLKLSKSDVKYKSLDREFRSLIELGRKEW